MAISGNGILAATVKPGKSVGPFILGASLYDVLELIRGNAKVFPQVEIIHSIEKALKSPIIIYLKPNGIRLQFDGRRQYLRLIEILEWGKTKLDYKNTELGKQSSVTFRQIYYKVFGPTYPGYYEEESQVYILSYPGISFNFNIPADISETFQGTDSYIKYLSQANAPTCSAFAIFSGHSWSEAKQEIMTDPGVFPSMFRFSGDKGPLEIRMVDLSILDENVAVVYTRNHASQASEDEENHFDITFGKSIMQTIIMKLGPPDERLFKQDSRLSIHNPHDKGESETDLIFNYFRYGMDICFDTLVSPPVVKKLILHGNIPGSLLFQKYKRCLWKILHGIDSETNFTDISQYLKIAQTSAMVLNRHLDSPSSSVEIVGEGEEVAPNNPVAEDWGLTELHGAPGAVFEILCANDTVSSVTLFERN